MDDSEFTYEALDIILSRGMSSVQVLAPFTPTLTCSHSPASHPEQQVFFPFLSVSCPGHCPSCWLHMHVLTHSSERRPGGRPLRRWEQGPGGQGTASQQCTSDTWSPCRGHMLSTSQHCLRRHVEGEGEPSPRCWAQGLRRRCPPSRPLESTISAPLISLSEMISWIFSYLTGFWRVCCVPGEVTVVRGGSYHLWVWGVGQRDLGAAGRAFGLPGQGTPCRGQMLSLRVSVLSGRPPLGRKEASRQWPPRDRLRVCCCAWCNTMVNGLEAQFLFLLAVVFSLLKVRGGNSHLVETL